jgi:hypothetical protein
MIETKFFILTEEMVAEHLPEASKLNVSLDYYLMEFVFTEGEWVECD